MSARVKDLLAAPLGRQFIHTELGFATFELYGRRGLGSPLGTAMLVAGDGGSQLSSRVRRSSLAEVPATGARDAIREMVSMGNWRAVEQASALAYHRTYEANLAFAGRAARRHRSSSAAASPRSVSSGGLIP